MDGPVLTYSVSMRILGTRQEMKATITVGKRRKIDKITGWILSIEKTKCTKIAPPPLHG